VAVVPTARRRSDLGILSQVDITAALPCDFAEVREGLLFISAAPVTRLWRAEYPAALGLCIAAIVEGTQGELEGIPHEVELVVCDQDGVVLAELKAGIQVAEAQGVAPGEALQLPMVFNLTGLMLGAPGAYDLRLRVDGGQALGQPERTVTVRAAVTQNAPGGALA